MAKHYKKRPSEIVSVEDSYIAYCFDEVCYYYENQATDEKGKINWSKIKWQDINEEVNQGLKQFANKYKR